jgi:hypothetical protein
MADTHEISYIGGELDLFALAKNWKGYIKREFPVTLPAMCWKWVRASAPPP